MTSSPQTPVSHTLAYAAAGPHVVTQLFDGELTLINLDTGHYFAAGGPAVDVWEIVSAGAKASEVIDLVSSRYAAPGAIVNVEVVRILQSYRDFGLISETPQAAAVRRTPIAPEAKTWETGWIEVYGDMKELLLLDPIHDVASAGWPPVNRGSPS